MSRDPLGYAAGENLYRYVLNNPTTYTDPWGLREKNMITVEWNLYVLQGLGDSINPEYQSKLYNELNVICYRDLTIPGCSEYFQSSQGTVESRTDVMFDVAFVAGGVVRYGIKKAGSELLEETLQSQACNIIAPSDPKFQIVCSFATPNYKTSMKLDDLNKLQNVNWSKVSKPKVDDEDLQRIMDDLYRPGANIGNGSTADAIRYERATGNSVGNRTHETKGQQQINRLENWLYGNGGYYGSKSDKDAAKAVIDDLKDALNN